MILTGSPSATERNGKPRASGDDPTRMIGASGACLVNPARAGMIHTQVRERFMPVGKPRASGDDPQARATVLLADA